MSTSRYDEKRPLLFTFVNKEREEWLQHGGMCTPWWSRTCGGDLFKMECIKAWCDYTYTKSVWKNAWKILLRVAGHLIRHQIDYMRQQTSTLKEFNKPKRTIMTGGHQVRRSQWLLWCHSVRQTTRCSQRLLWSHTWKLLCALCDLKRQRWVEDD